MKKVNCGLLILKISKIVIYQFWYDQVKPKYGEKKMKLCYMDTGTLIVKGIAKDLETRFDISSYELESSLRRG